MQSLMAKFDLTSSDGQNAACKELSKTLREVQHALVGVETIILAVQLLSGLCTTEEMVCSVVAKGQYLPKLQVDDIDWLTGLRVMSQAEIEARQGI